MMMIKKEKKQSLVGLQGGRPLGTSTHFKRRATYYHVELNYTPGRTAVARRRTFETASRASLHVNSFVPLSCPSSHDVSIDSPL